MSDPDFASLYEPSVISPRLAARLWLGAGLLAETSRSDLDGLRRELPPIAQRHADPEWLARFAGRFDLIARRLETGVADLERLAACTADEVAIHLIIDFVTDVDGDGLLDPSGDLDRLPNGPGHDDIATARELCLRDIDVLLLYNPALDGIEDPGTLTDHGHAHLHPHEWFEPFADND